MVYAVTLEECKELSLHNSRLLESYENGIKSALYARRKDLSALLPQLSASYEPEHLHFSDRSEFTPGSQSRVGVTLSYDLQKLLVNYPQLSHLELEKSKLIKKVAENENQKDLVQAYYKLFVLLKKKRNYADAQAFIRDHIKNIEELQSRGVDVKLDLIRANVQLTSLSTSLSNITGEIENDLIALNSMMNTTYQEAEFSSMDAPDVAAIKIDQAAQDKETPEAETEDSYIGRVEKLVPCGIGKLEQSKLDAFDVTIAKANHQRSTWYFLPSLQGGFEHNSHTVDPNTEENRTFLTLHIDISDWAQKATAERELHYSYEAQKKLFEENQRKLRVRIEQLISELETVQTTYQNALDNVTGAESSLVTAKEYFRQGKIKETDLLSVFSEYLVAKDASNDLLYSFLSKKGELDSLITGMGP